MAAARLFKGVGENKTFFLLLLVWAVAGLVINLCWTQQTLFFAVNKHTALHDPVFNTIMPLWTNLGDGVFFAAACVIFLFVSLRGAFASGIILLSTGLVVQLMKQVIFTGYHRPYEIFKGMGEIAMVEGYHPYLNNSFPSGHTTTAFALMAFLAMVWKRPIWGAILFLAALVTAYSRLYLGQHNFIDVYVGSLLGSIISILVYGWVYRENSVFARAAWKRGLLTRKAADE